MSSSTETSNAQPNIRHIPIFVEGRDEPIINKNHETGSGTSGNRESPINNNSAHASASASSTSNMFNNKQQQHQANRPEPSVFDKHFPRATGRESSPDTGGIDFPKMSQFSHLVKDFPVRNLGASLFRSESPHRAASPGRQVPVFHTSASANASAPHKPSPPPQQQQYHPQQQQSQQVPHYDNIPQQQQRQQTPPKKSASQNSNPESTMGNVDEPDSKAAAASPPQPPVDSITKIQNIQRDVLNLMDWVDKFECTSRKDKNYLYLDEMLTQNLLKLDTIDTEGQDNIKLARREAIKCINHCISVLEAKAEAGAAAAAAANSAAGAGAVKENNSSNQNLSNCNNASGYNSNQNNSSSGNNIAHPTSNSSQNQQPQQ